MYKSNKKHIILKVLRHSKYTEYVESSNYAQVVNDIFREKKNGLSNEGIVHFKN